MEAAGSLVVVVVELTARVEHREDHFQRALLARPVLVDGYAAPIVLDRDRRTVLVKGHPDVRGVSVHGLVDRVVEDLPDEVMETGAADAADVHARAAPNGLEPLEDGDVFCCICHLNAVLTLIGLRDWGLAISPRRLYQTRDGKYECAIGHIACTLRSGIMKRNNRKDGAMRLPLQITLAAAVFATATTAQAQMRFQGMDTNRDGVITRAEWRGNDTSFRNQDWNGDGILSGEEVRTGGRRQTNWNQDWNRDGRVDNLDTQISQRFRGYDMNNDNRVARSEWPGDARLFTRLDTNRDGYLSMEEYTQGGGFTLDSQGGPPSRFSNIDMNNDGWVTRNEWNMGDQRLQPARRESRQPHQPVRVRERHGRVQRCRYSPAQFNTFDANRDGWLTRRIAMAAIRPFDTTGTTGSAEFERAARPPNDRFDVVDHDGWRARNGADEAVHRLDDRDNRQPPSTTPRSQPNRPKRGVAQRLRPRNSGRARGRPRGLHPPAGMGSRRAARARAGRLGLHIPGRNAERLSGRLSRRVQERVSRGLHGSRRTGAAVE